VSAPDVAALAAWWYGWPRLALGLGLALAVAGALLYRARGTGWREFVPGWPMGTQFNRVVLWAAPTGALAGIAAGMPLMAWTPAFAVAGIDVPPVLLPPVAGPVLALFVGLMVPHARWQDGGTVAGTARGDYAGMSLVCGGRGALVALSVAWWSPPVAAAAVVGGLLAGPAYALGDRTPIHLPPWLPARTMCWGEFHTGAAFWAALFVGGILT
jgi:hypothetical protein